MKIFTFVLFAASLLLASCSLDSLDDNNASKEKDIQFSLNNDNGVNTSRAATATQQMITQYGVSCSYYPSILSYTSAACGSYFFDVKVDAADGKPGYFWPGKKYRLSFFAYYPCDDPNINLVSDLGQNGMPEYEYNIPSDVTQQVDFLTCNILDHEGSSTEPIPLKFNHKCAEIKFTAHNKTDEDITVKSICIKGMKYQGRLVDDRFVLNGEANSDSKNPFFLNADEVIEADATIDVTKNDKHFIVLPQTVTAGTEIITVKTVEDGKEVTYTHTLPSDFSFQEGKSYCFKLCLGHELMTVEQVTILPWQDVEDSKRIEKYDAAESKVVDLDLPSGNLWAAGNLGAENVTDTGLFFAWGETTGYTADSGHVFNEENYTAGDWNADLDPDHDAAHANLGGGWHIPTKADFDELIAYTTHTWTYNYQGSGVAGCIMKSTMTKAEIFFPATGCSLDSSKSMSNFVYAWYVRMEEGALSFDARDVAEDFFSSTYLDKYAGIPVRGVYK